MATVGVSANRLEILQIANAVGRRRISTGASCSMRWRSHQKAARSRYGSTTSAPRSTLTRARPSWRVQTVVETVESVTVAG
jgi:hypothetical protein